jgi:LAO/AO transport system kinase
MSEGQIQSDLVERLLDGQHRALARVITKIENRSPGYRDLVSALHEHTGDASIIGVTGSPGAGKSTLVDKLAREYRDRGLTVGVIAVDPSSPYSGGAVLGDRIRMASTLGDMDVFFRSMSARGQLGGLATATADAIRALDAFGKDRIIVETVGAGQNEVDIVKTADTVAVLVQPGSGDDVQMLKAGILEIGDVFVVNKADMEGAQRTVSELEEMIHLRQSDTERLAAGPAGHDVGHHGDEEVADHHGDEEVAGHHGHDQGHGHDDHASHHAGDGEQADAAAEEPEPWRPQVVETVATSARGVDDLVDTFERHREFLVESGRLAERERSRYAEEVRRLFEADISDLVETELERLGGVDDFAAAIQRRETDPYTVADEVLDPVVDCLEARHDDETR